MSKITRAVRFSQNESILRNTIIRLKINISGEERQSYSVDFGPSETLPLPEIRDPEKLSLKERERQNKVISNLDNQFTLLPELEGEDLNFSERIIIQGVGASDKDYIQTEGSFSLYFYPTGEKDSAMIFLSSYDEIGTVSIQNYSPEPDIAFHFLRDANDVNLIERSIKEYYEKWRKN